MAEPGNGLVGTHLGETQRVPDRSELDGVGLGENRLAREGGAHLGRASIALGCRGESGRTANKGRG